MVLSRQFVVDISNRGSGGEVRRCADEENNEQEVQVDAWPSKRDQPAAFIAEGEVLCSAANLLAHSGQTF
jgi:hypothetical protein